MKLAGILNELAGLLANYHHCGCSNGLALGVAVFISLDRHSRELDRNDSLHFFFGIAKRVN